MEKNVPETGDWALSLVEIMIVAREIARSDNYRLFGASFFEKYKIKMDDIQKSEPHPLSANEICEKFLDRLQQRMVPVKEVIAALEHPDVGIKTAAKLIKDKCNIASADDKRESNPLAMTKFLVTPKNNQEEAEQLLYSTVPFTLEGYFAGYPVYSYYPLIQTEINCPCHVMMFGIEAIASTFDLMSLLGFASSLLMLIKDSEKRRYEEKDIMEKISSLPNPFCNSFMLIWRKLQEPEHSRIRKLFFGLPFGGRIEEDVDLAFWTAENEKWKARDKWYIGLQFQKVTTTFNEMHRITKEVVSLVGLKAVSSHGGADHSSDIFISGSVILPMVLFLKKYEIKLALESRGLQLISIYELSIEDIVMMQDNPNNQPYKRDLENLIEKMIEDKVPMVLDNESRWRIVYDSSIQFEISGEPNLPEHAHLGLQNAPVEEAFMWELTDLKNQQGHYYFPISKAEEVALHTFNRRVHTSNAGRPSNVQKDYRSTYAALHDALMKAGWTRAIDGDFYEYWKYVPHQISKLDYSVLA